MEVVKQDHLWFVIENEDGGKENVVFVTEHEEDTELFIDGDGGYGRSYDEGPYRTYYLFCHLQWFKDWDWKKQATYICECCPPDI